MRTAIKCLCAAMLAGFCWTAAVAQGSEDFDAPLRLPNVGDAQLRIISPSLLELNLINTKAPAPGRITNWNFVAANLQFALPAPGKFSVTANGSSVLVESVGYKRRPIYANFRKRDLRIGNQIYLKLARPLSENDTISVANPDGSLWPASHVAYRAEFAPHRYSPAIHVNQAGYVPEFSKKAMVGLYLGTFGELEVPAGNGFKLVDARSGAIVFEGALVRRTDTGYSYTPPPYQRVYEADFSAFSTAGTYKLVVPGLGASYPFRIHDGAAAAIARAYALGIYHQRCGTSNALPFTRHVHDPCHAAAAEVPNDTFTAVNKALANFSADYASNPRHAAPQLSKVSASLYPFVNSGRVDVSGGHHDAGDYSKYTINSAQFIHSLIFAADNYEGLGLLDNLGLPESGDGVADMLQIAKWEADFLAKMQDADGGFYFLVYPRNRSYEDNVLPDRGDPQVVFPKTTSATAAAVAALAQTASSPAFKQAFPQDAARYLQAARKGWEFLQAAFSKHGRDGAYQKINHYGDKFLHDDEVIWAATELFLATGDRAFEPEFIGKFDPASRQNYVHGWVRMWEGFGAAIRSYTFAARSGRVAGSALNAAYLAKCEAEMSAAADEQIRFSQQHCYGSSFPDPDKNFRTAGWFFSLERTFDLPAADRLQSKAALQNTILYNLNYEAGCNPLNVSFITGVGHKRQREMVHQYAINDRRALPPSGLPLGNIQKTYQSTLPLYPNELTALTFPNDLAAVSPHAPYEAWGDVYNVTAEFVNPQQARGLAAAAWLMAKTPLKAQPWRSGRAEIVLSAPEVAMGESATISLASQDVSLSEAQIVWEARNFEPAVGSSIEIVPGFVGRYWIEAEASMPDGRRVFAIAELNSTAVPPRIVGVTATHLRVSGTVGQSFVIEASEDLHSWIPVSNGTFSSEDFGWTDESGEGLPARFYRVISGL